MYSEKEKIRIVEAFLESGLTATHAGRRPGWPCPALLKRWVKEAREGKLAIQVAIPKGHTGNRKSHARYSKETKAEAIRLYEMGRRPKEVARLLGIDCSANVRVWWNKAKAGTLDTTPFKPQSTKGESEIATVTKKKGVPPEVAALNKSELENACLRAVLADLKVGGWDLDSISNKKKCELGERLRRGTGRALQEIIDFLKISKSSYEYHRARLHREDPCSALRARIAELFWKHDARYGYRRIWACLKGEGIRVSEKVVRRIMREGALNIRYKPKAKRFCSYGGENTHVPENLIKRNFHAKVPNILWLTDITEFSVGDFKCYLSPVIDCFDGKVVSWKLSQSPDAKLVNSMLDDAINTLNDQERPIIHSDRGFHYRWPGWIIRIKKAGLTHSMSAKGCCADNSACEGFFGRLKNEFFYHSDWKGIDYDSFASLLDEYIVYYNEERIKKSLGYLSPSQYRKSLGIAV